MGFEGFPFIIGWELTLTCNLRCRHCGSTAGSPRENELSTQEALSLCDQFPALLVQEVNFTGGEPLLRADWMLIANRLAGHDIKTKVITNGLSLAPDTIRQMADAGIAGVGVSLDGLAKTHDYIRGYDGLFKKVLAGLESLMKAGIPATVITTANGLNISELPEIMSLLRRIGIRQWQIQPIFPTGRSKDATDLRLTEQQYLDLGLFYQRYESEMRKDGLEILPGDSFGYFTELDNREPPWRGCPAGLYSCGITSHGLVKGCLSLPDEVAEGDVRKNDLWDIWFHSDSFAYTRGFSLDRVGSNCNFCDKVEQCKGGCSAMSYGSTGLFHNDPFCFMAINKAKRAADGPVESGPDALIAPRKVGELSSS
jgi:radical SAM protein with 4Fe4S-binding SPASM domain